VQRWMVRRLYPLACGGITLGWLQALGGINWNALWFQFLLTWLSALVTLLLGGEVTAGQSGDSGSLFGGLF